jgi:isopentenyl diphosphate isomerase/L-lactate dehydrogenase-like FMN-dependent dehydrogenase
MSPAAPSRRRFLRRFLRFLAASPAFGTLRAQQTWPPQPLAIASPADAMSVMDFEQVAHQKLPPAHFGYMTSGVDDDLTLKANRDGFRKFTLHPRRLIDVGKVDTRIELFGSWESPIFLCPIGGQRMYHPEGEAGVARAAKAKNAVQILSTGTSTPVEDVARARGTPPWYQLYLPVRWTDTERLVRRVEAAGCPVMAITIDGLGGRNLETSARFRRMDTRDCTVCHIPGEDRSKSHPMYAGFEEYAIEPKTANWSLIDRIRKLTRMKLLLKDIDTAEDARLCREHGIDGIVVSNHGGRSTETERGTIECLSEVVDAAGPQLPVLIDGGFRRGTDIYKALALGARAVGIGRPYVWGLASFGQTGVERVVDILRAELELAMRQCGTPSIGEITAASIRKV